MDWMLLSIPAVVFFCAWRGAAVQRDRAKTETEAERKRAEEAEAAADLAQFEAAGLREALLTAKPALRTPAEAVEQFLHEGR